MRVCAIASFQNCFNKMNFQRVLVVYLSTLKLNDNGFNVLDFHRFRFNIKID